MIARIRSAIAWRRRYWADRAVRPRWVLLRLLDHLRPAVRAPAMTLVVVGRNDDYGGNFKGRLAATLTWNLAIPQVREAIYVEWNPVPGAASDAGWLLERHAKLTVYTVSPRRHALACRHPKMPLMEYFAKNVGLRRATAPWVAVVNADVLIGPDAVRRMSRLRPGTVYACHCVNIRWAGEALDAAALLDPSRHLGGFSVQPSMFSSVGDFVLAERELWQQARGYDEALRDRRLTCDSHGVAQLYHLGARGRVLGSYYHLDHPESARNVHADHQGTSFDPWQGVPYANPDDWGQADAAPRLLGERWFALD